MANHKSALKRIRANESKRLRNRYQLKSTRTVLKKLRLAEDKKSAEDLYKTVQSMLDKLVKRNIIHKNNAANKKSGLKAMIASLAK